MKNEQVVSSYMGYLPALFHQDPFIGRFLLAFEQIFKGLAGAVPDPVSGLGQPSLEETIDQVARYFDPMATDEEFLPWLSSWVALTLRADWDTATKRSFIQQIVPLYRLRGTKAGLQQMLELYTRESVTIDDDFERPAHFFQVQLTLSEPDPDLLRHKQQIVQKIIEREKPAHTFYALQVAVPTMRLVSLELQQREEDEKGSEPPLLVLGDNTILGTENSSK